MQIDRCEAIIYLYIRNTKPIIMQQLRSALRLALTISLLLVVTSSMFSQHWSKEYNASPNNITESVFIDMCELENGNIAGLINGSRKILNILAEDGSTIRNIYLDQELENAYSLFYEDSSIYIGGHTEVTFQSDAKLLKYDLEGNKLWERSYSDGFISSILSYNGGLLLGGKTDGPGASEEGFIIHTNIDGEPYWTNTYELHSTSQVGRFVVDGNRCFAIFKAVATGVGFHGIVVTEIDPNNGNFIWREDYDVGSFSQLFDYGFDGPLGAVLSGDDIIVVTAGSSYGNSSTLFKVSKDGQNVRTTKLYYDYGMIPFDVAVGENDEIFIAGIYKDDTYSAAVEKRDREGNLLWRQYFEDGNFFRIRLIDGYIVASGCTPNFVENAENFPYIVKMSLDGNVYNSGAEIVLKIDDLGNCDETAAVSLLDSDIVIRIEGERYLANADGKYTINKPPGVYDVEFELAPIYDLCQADYQVSIVENEMTEISLTLNKVNTVFLEVGMTKTELLESEGQSIFIDYANTGNVDSENTMITLSKDDRIEILSTSLPFEMNLDGQYVFDLTSLESFESGKIIIVAQAVEDLLESTHLDMEVSISSANMQSLTLEDYIEVNAKCVDDKVRFEINNMNTSETFDLDLVYFIDGYTDEKDSIDLLPGTKFDLDYLSEGHAATLQVLHNEKIIKSVSYAGCDHFDNNLYSVNVSPQMYHVETSKSRDKVTYEVVHQKSGNRILQDNLGIGDDQILQPDAEDVRYNLRFINKSDTIINNLRATIDLFPQKNNDPVSYKASSHQYEPFLVGNQLQIVVTEPILAHQEFHLRVNIPIRNYNGEDDLLYSRANWSDGNTALGLEAIAFNNQTDYLELESENISPFTQIAEGQIFGTSAVTDFVGELIILPDGSELVIMGSNENTRGKRLSLYKVQADKVLWQKIIAFDEGGATINDYEILEDGNILLIGSMYEQSRTDNYIHNNFYKVINQDGDDIDERIWTEGIGVNEESKLTSVQKLDDGNFAFYGYKSTDTSRSYFRMVVDQNYNELSSQNIYLPSALYPLPRTRKYEDYVVHSYFAHAYNIPSSFKVYGNDGTTYTSPQLDFEFPNGDRFMGDFHVLQNGNMIRGGSYTEDISATETEEHHVIMECNIFGNPLNTIEIMPDAYSFRLEKLAPKGENYLVAGSWRSDSLSNSHILFMEVDPSGEVLWMDGRKMGSRESVRGNLISAEGRDYCSFQTQSIDAMENLQGGYIYRNWDPLSTDDNLKSTNEITVSPNPTSNQLQINMEGEVKEYIIISTRGALIRRIENPSYTLDVSDLITGKYFLGITLENGQKEFVPFVKM